MWRRIEQDQGCIMNHAVSSHLEEWPLQDTAHITLLPVTGVPKVGSIELWRVSAPPAPAPVPGNCEVNQSSELWRCMEGGSKLLGTA